MKRAAVIEQLKQTQDNLAKLLALSKPARQTSLPRTFINPADNTAAPASDPTKATRLSNKQSSQPTRSHRALDSTDTFAQGSTCCEFMSEMSCQQRAPGPLLK
jgi:hypothetical protein